MVALEPKTQPDAVPQANTAQTLWLGLVADFRQACMLRREGREAEATVLLKEKLPQATALWSRADGRPAAEKKVALEQMFKNEQAGVDAWLSSQETLTQKVVITLLPMIRQEIREGLREAFAANGLRTPADTSHRASSGTGRRACALERAGRIRFDDIPGVIDSLLAEQSADFGARPALTYS